MKNDHVDEVFRGILNGIATSCNAQRDRLVDMAEAHEGIPDFADVNTVREIMPTRLAPFIADLMSVFQMGPHANHDELMRSCAKIEREMFRMYRDLG